MKPIVNLEENPGKTVGHRQPRVEDYDKLVRMTEAIMPRLPFPKGVFRFKTHEEADSWTEKHLLQAAQKMLRERRKEPI